MESDILVLAATAISIGTIHTVLGPDHYLPFIAIGKARNWSYRQTIGWTLLCGLGHVAGSIVLGAIGIALGLGVGRLEGIEGARGDLAGWLVLGFGLAYAVWGLRQVATAKAHHHVHVHADGTVHDHNHGHRAAHAHPHLQAQPAKPKANITPWVLFTIFVLGPCEPLIPLLMYPAAQHDWGAIALVAGVFGVATLATMVAVVSVAFMGLSVFNFSALERHTHTLAGAAVASCGAAMVFLGL